MKLALLSDLHLEEHPDEGEAYLNSLISEGIDLLVLAGDICSAQMLPEVMKWFSTHYPQIIYVLGNHEYHGSSFEEVHQICSRLPSNVEWLEDRSIEWSGHHFLGATLWFEEEERSMRRKNRLSDFREIAHFEQEVFLRNQQSRDFLASEIRADSIVITHHLPTPLAIPDRFKDSDLIPFFCCDLSSLAQHPKLWMFGHTHWHVDIKAESHFLANPLGNFEQRDSGHISDLSFSLFKH